MIAKPTPLPKMMMKLHNTRYPYTNENGGRFHHMSDDSASTTSSFALIEEVLLRKKCKTYYRRARFRESSVNAKMRNIKYRKAYNRKPCFRNTARIQSPNKPPESKPSSSLKSVKLNNFLIIIKQSSSSFDTWQRICRINNVNGRYDVSQNYQYKASFYLDNVWVRDGTGKCEEKAKYSAAKKALVYFTKNQNIFVVDTTEVPEKNIYSIDANTLVAIEKCDLQSIFRFHLNSFIDNHEMVKLELRNINGCSRPLVENHFNEMANCFKLIKELPPKKKRKAYRKVSFYKENSVTHKMDGFLLRCKVRDVNG